jgi:serine/threonine protein kinase
MLKVAIKEIKSMGTWEIEKAWATEARALQATNRLNHPHILKGIAVIHQDKSRYFMFPCAENSLRDYWEATPAQSPSPRLIREGVNQVRGLADALDKLHNFRSHISQNEKFREVEIGHDLVDKSPPLSPSGMDDDDVASFHPNSLWEESIRHGDIKPENILRFLAKTSNTETLKLADIGLAKENSIATEQQRGTSMRYGTRRYEGPEVLDYVHGRSRLFDVWALGCVTFEYILWLLYGNHAIVEFYRQAEISSAPSDFQYYQVQMMGEGQQRAAVHPIVVEWLDHMQNEDPECQPDSKSMMKDLLHIVREKLLVVDLPPTRGSALSIGGGGRILVPSFVGVRLRYRATAAEFRDGLEIMERKAWDPSYVFTGRDRSHVNLPSLQKTLRRVFEGSYRQDTISSIGIKTGSLLRPSVASRSLLHPVVVSRSISAVYSRPSLDSWKFDVDNEFAEKVMKDVDVGNFREHETTSHRFCKRCAKLNFWSSGFEIEDEVGALAKSAANCELCQLLHDASCGTNNLHNGKICFERTQSVITMTGSTFPVLSLMRSPGEPVASLCPKHC